MNVHEALEYTENLVVSSIDDLSDDEDFISRGRLIILPPNDGGHRDTDEYELHPNNLRSQLSEVNFQLVLLLMLVHQVAIFR